jgi:hypothetical protein
VPSSWPPCEASGTRRRRSRARAGECAATTRSPGGNTSRDPPGAELQTLTYGGAINRIGPGDTAFVHRNALFLAQYTTTWDTDAPAAAVGQQASWQRGFYASMRPYASGQAYQNYIDPPPSALAARLLRRELPAAGSSQGHLRP